MLALDINTSIRVLLAYVRVRVGHHCRIMTTHLVLQRAVGIHGDPQQADHGALLAAGQQQGARSVPGVGHRPPREPALETGRRAGQAQLLGVQLFQVRRAHGGHGAVAPVLHDGLGHVEGRDAGFSGNCYR